MDCIVVFSRTSGVDFPNNSVSYSRFTSSVRGTEAFGLLPLPFFLRSFCFGFKAILTFSNSMSFIMLLE